jgi:hypothetical protein
MTAPITQKPAKAWVTLLTNPEYVASKFVVKLHDGQS